MTRQFRATSRTRGLAALSATAIAAATLLVAPAAPAAQATTAHVRTEVFTSSKATRWTPPAGVTHLTVEVAGARGGDGPRGSWTTGGKGGLVTFEMDVTEGAEFTFYGATTGSGRTAGKGWRTGGTGGQGRGDGFSGSGGGGAAAVLLDGQVIAVAGGGGGAGGYQKNTVAIELYGTYVRGGNGGNAGENGSDGVWYYQGTKPGKGAAGAARPGKGGANGTPSAYFSDASGGGGGGGGWASGNGGGSGKYSGGTGGGGGGGSSWVDPGYSATITHHDAADGWVRVSYTIPVTLALNVPDTFVAGQEVVGTAAAFELETWEGVFGRHVILVDGAELDSSIGWSSWFTFSLTPGQHTIEYRFVEGEDVVAQTSKTLTVTPAGGGLGSPDAVQIDLGMTQFVFSTEQSIVVTGTLETVNGDPAMGVLVELHFGSTLSGTAPTDASGAFTLVVPAGTAPGNHTVRLETQATPLYLAAEPMSIPIRIVEELTTVAIVSVSSMSPAYGEPIDVVARVSAADGTGPAPTGVVVIADDEDLIGIASIAADGTATFSGLLPHRDTTTLRALYAGDAVYDSAVSTAWDLVVRDAATETMLDVASATGHAGDLTAIQVTVTAAAGSILEPLGHVELLVNGEEFASAANGSDEDATPGDGHVVYTLDTDHLPAGNLVLQARFVPSTGFAASESAPIELNLVDHETRLVATPASLTLGAGRTAVVHAHVDVLGHEGVLMRQASGAPSPEGVVVAYLGDDQVASADLDPSTGDAELRISDLAGSGSLRLVFYPDALGLASDEISVVFTVDAGTLPVTGIEDPAPVLGAAMLALLLGLALLAVGRRRGFVA